MSVLIRMLIAFVALSSLSLTWLSACGVTGMLGDTGNPLVSIDVTPETGSVTPGELVQYAAQGKFRDGSTRNLTASVTWSSPDPGAALVDIAGRATGVSHSTGPEGWRLLLCRASAAASPCSNARHTWGSSAEPRSINSSPPSDMTHRASDPGLGTTRANLVIYR